ncbi:hypothetical protein [Halohasta salina]|uniref:hypothetical protein n=1 Tax=Halohasta salina TaxID=2961621 RepID=UPI0020A57618|nr:hypothetical protein [Halohasta salina]
MSTPALDPHNLATEFIEEKHAEQSIAETLHELDEHPEAEWIPLGREPNNYSIVENQQADAMAAFTELVVNSIDAIILRAFFEKFGDEYEGDEYSSLEEAANDLIDKEEDEIEVTAHGEQNGPFSLTLYDNGCGQTQSDFEHTFLNVLTPGEIKQEFDFLQGKYGMGSTGVLPFCGERGYKFIASSAFDEPGKWSWSIIRQNREKTRYEYLTVNGRPPQFSGKLADREQGTYIKCFNYESEVKSTITKRFRHRLERYVVESPVPIRLNETRYGDSYGAPKTEGLLPSIWDKKQYLQDHDRIEHTFDNDVLGTKNVNIFLFKDKDQLKEIGLSEKVTESFVTGAKQTKQAILFTYNGQTHGDQGQTFLKRRCNLRRISNDTLVVIDFSDINDADVVDLFKPSRDRLQNKDPSKVLKSELEDLLKSNEILLEEEERRRTKDIEEESEDLEEDILDDILRRNPSLKGYLKEGKKTPTIDKQGEEEADYEGNFYPSEFNIIKKYRSRSDYDIWENNDNEDQYTVQIPENKTSLQRFELDATNDYLTRDKDRGSVDVSLPSMVKSKRLKNGVLSLRFDPPDAFSPGNQVNMEVTVSPTQGTGSMSQTITVEVTEPVEKTKTNTPKDQNEGAAGYELPDAHFIGEEDWDEYDMDEHSIVRLYPGPENDMTLYINEDSAPYVNFRQRHNLKESGKTYVKQTYKLGMILFSVGQYIEIEQETKDDPQWEEIDPVEVVETTMRGVAQSFLDQTITDDKLKQITY